MFIYLKNGRVKVVKDFFDTAASKAKEAFDTVCQFTEDAVTTGKQKFDIASMENKVNKLYRELGELAYKSAVGADQNHDQIDMMVSKITDKLNEIAAAKEELAKNANKKVCKECGELIEKKAGYCSRCGAQVNEQ